MPIFGHTLFGRYQLPTDFKANWAEPVSPLNGFLGAQETLIHQLIMRKLSCLFSDFFRETGRGCNTGVKGSGVLKVIGVRLVTFLQNNVIINDRNNKYYMQSFFLTGMMSTRRQACS